MNKICEFCKNNEEKYLPYPTKNEIYINLKCFHCKKEFYICSICKKYHYIKNENDKYKKLSNNLQNRNSMCDDCFIINIKSKYKFCNMCSEYKIEINYYECDKCYELTCKKCSKNNICSICEL